MSKVFRRNELTPEALAVIDKMRGNAFVRALQISGPITLDGQGMDAARGHAVVMTFDEDKNPVFTAVKKADAG